MHRSRYPVPLLEKVQDAARHFIDAIDASVRTADHCIIFASDLVELCGSLNEQPTTDVHKFVNEIQQIGQKAYDNVEDRLNRFRALRSTLIQVRFQVMLSIEATIEKVDRSYVKIWTTSDVSITAYDMVRTP